MKPDKPIDDGNPGEGDHLSTRRHARNVREFVAGSKGEPAARNAEIRIEPQTAEAGRAERQVRRALRPTKVTIDELVAKGHTVIDRLGALVHRVADRIGGRRRPR
jgi:hypothetical protein